ncbi:MAG: segregation/condensation protein A [Christensenellaceae bacterium]|nr:segregation/condensation protein A [Christensenellaceae bacterium]
MEFKLKQFEGPLDLLLHLINKSKIAVEDIFVSDITEQYLEYMDALSEPDMDSASEFLAMAALLLEIKSRSLLPKPPSPAEDEEDPQQLLIRRLKEYKQIKENSQKLRENEHMLEGRYYKLPQELIFDKRFELSEASLETLMEAFREVLSRVEQKRAPAAVREIRRDMFSVREKITYLKRRLTDKKQLSFYSLFESDSSRQEVIATFLALLELCKQRFLLIKQNALFSDIAITLADNGREEEAE